MKTVVALLLGLLAATSAQAADKAQAEAAIAAASQTEDQAGKLGNRWIVAEAALKAAKTAMAAGDWATAATEAARAESLAHRAIEQSQEQETTWRDAVVR